MFMMKFLKIHRRNEMGIKENLDKIIDMTFTN